MNVLSIDEAISLKHRWQRVNRPKAFLTPIALVASLVAVVALTTLACFSIYARVYQLSLFDASIKRFTLTAVVCTSYSAPFLILSLLLARMHGAARIQLFLHLRNLLEQRVPHVDKKFVLEKLLGSISSDVVKKLILSEVIRTYKKKRQLDPKSASFKVVTLLEKIKKELSKPEESQEDSSGNEMARKLREMGNV